MIEPTVLNVVCPQCEQAWMLPINERAYMCPCCQYVGYERDLKEKANALYNDRSPFGNFGEPV